MSCWLPTVWMDGWRERERERVPIEVHRFPRQPSSIRPDYPQTPSAVLSPRNTDAMPPMPPIPVSQTERGRGRRVLEHPGGTRAPNLGFRYNLEDKGNPRCRARRACTRRPIPFSRSIEPIVSVHARIHGGPRGRVVVPLKRYAPVLRLRGLFGSTGILEFLKWVNCIRVSLCKFL